MKIKWTIKNKLIGLALCSLVLAAGIGLSGYWGLTRIDASMDKIVVSGSVMRDHLEADMMHDALRGDVLAALVSAESKNPEEKKEALDDLAKHTKLFQDRIQEIEGHDINEEVKKELMEIHPVLNAYIKSAQEMASLAFTNRPAALSRMGEFRASFYSLEEEMEKLSNLIEKSVQESQAEGDRAVVFSKNGILLMTAVSFLLLFTLSFLCARSITNGLMGVARVAKAVTAGNLTARNDLISDDEVGQLALAFNEMTQSLQTLVSQVQDGVNQIASASEELSASSQEMRATTEKTERQTQIVSAATEETDRSIQTVVSATEEMSATIKEISKNVQEATRITTQAVKVAESTNATISKLGDSSAEIGNVIKVITSIAQQTNLLALNATIEAARAGEAGKGFAVVANEVKDLAKATAKATEEIGQKITAIQGDTQGAVSAIGEIKKIIKQINDLSMNVAGAVEEQATTTTEISRSVSEAARGTGEVVQNISGVATASKRMAEGAANVLAASMGLAKMGGELMAMVNKFHVDASGQRGVVNQARGAELATRNAAVSNPAG